MIGSIGGAYLEAPVWALSGLLGLAGALKLSRPGPTVDVMKAAGLGRLARPAGVRVLATGECLAGGVALLFAPAAAIAATAILYASFAAFLSYVLLSGREVESCGCAGRSAVPPNWIHVGLNGAAALIAAAAALSPPSGLVGATGLWPAGQLVLLLIAAGWTAFLAYVCVTILPEVMFAYRRGDRSARTAASRPADRGEDIERALLQAGIGADHPSLWGGVAGGEATTGQA